MGVRQRCALRRTSELSMKGMDKSHKDEGAGHAAALGKPADVKHATRTIEIVMGVDGGRAHKCDTGQVQVLGSGGSVPLT